MKILGRFKSNIHLWLLNFKWYKQYHFSVEKRKFMRHRHEEETMVLKASELLKKLNVAMRAKGWSRQRRKQFWRDFIKNDLFRDDILDQIENGYNKSKE